jgi:hypothetical protein
MNPTPSKQSCLNLKRAVLYGLMDTLSQFDVSKYPEPQRATVMAALSEIVLMKLARQLYEELSATDQAILDKLDDEPTPEQSQRLWDFFRGHFPDLDARIQKLVEQEQIELKTRLDDMIELITQSRESS